MVDFSTKAPTSPKKVEPKRFSGSDMDKDITIDNINEELKAVRKERDEMIDLNFKLTKDYQALKANPKMPELDIDGFQKWVKGLNASEHIEKTLIIQMQKYGKSAFLAYFKSLYQKYQKGIK